MATLLDSATNGFGPDVTVSSSFAQIRITGIRENSPSRVQLHWSEDGVLFEPIVEVMQWDRSYPVDLPAGSGTVKANVLGANDTDAISAVITFG